MTIAKAEKRIANARIVRSGSLANYDVNAASFNCAVHDEGVPSKTIQSEKENCDINVIVARFGVTNTVPQVVRLPEYGDYDGIGDFHTAMNVIKEAEESFMGLPATVRSRFQNDPQQFLDFCENPENIDELRKMGLANTVSSDKMPLKPEDSPKAKKKEPDNVDSKSRVDVSAAKGGKAESGADGD